MTQFTHVLGYELLRSAVKSAHRKRPLSNLGLHTTFSLGRLISFVFSGRENVPSSLYGILKKSWLQLRSLYSPESERIRIVGNLHDLAQYRSGERNHFKAEKMRQDPEQRNHCDGKILIGKLQVCRCDDCNTPNFWDHSARRRYRRT